MRVFDYFLIPDVRLLATRFAIYTGLRACWWYFLTRQFDYALGAIFPNPFRSLTGIANADIGRHGLGAVGAAMP